MKKAERDNQRNQALLKGFPLVFRNLRTQSKAVSPKNIMMDSIKMNLDCVSRAVSANRKYLIAGNYFKAEAELTEENHEGGQTSSVVAQPELRHDEVDTGGKERPTQRRD